MLKVVEERGEREEEVGRGTLDEIALRGARQMLVQITSSGAVHIAVIGDMPGTAKADPLSFAPSRAFLAAMSGFEPERGGICSPRTHSRPGIETCVPSIPDSGRDRNEQTSVSLPLPET